MTKTRKLDRAYDRSEPAERFRLVVAAQARDDHRELDLLARSCPRHDYRMLDRRFVERLELAHEVARAFAAEVLVLAARHDDAQTARRLAEMRFGIAADKADFAGYQAKASSRARSAVSEAIGESREDYLAVFDELVDTLMANGSTAAHGFAAFCRDELLLAAETLLQAGAPIAIPTFRWLIAQPADAQSVADYQTDLSRVWRDRLGLNSSPTPAATPVVPDACQGAADDQSAEPCGEPNPTPGEGSVTTSRAASSEPTHESS